jgi:D-alanyl-D-alanine carboxypeptidase
MASGHRIGIALRDEGRTLYQHKARLQRAPASNEKLLLSMALFDQLDPSDGLDTYVYGNAFRIGGTVEGNVWLSGRGDPTLTAGQYGRDLPFNPTKLGILARAVKRSGITSITGRVMGNTGYFKHDWYAPGWRYYFPSQEVPLPSATTFDGNTYGGRHIRNPEYRAARAFTRRLEAIGVDVQGRPGAAWMPDGKALLAEIESAPLYRLVSYMNRWSSNFFAEVLGKRLGAERRGAPGTIAKGARAIEGYAARRGVTLTAKDSSGLSYRNRVSPRGIVKLLGNVEATTDWYEVLRDGLPTGGQGTLEDRLTGIPIRAKTGTLSGVSALSGWIYLRKTGTWAEFSILSRGLSYYGAKGLEDRIIRLITRLGR